MDSFIQMLNVQCVLLLYMICGVICRRLKIITPQNQQQFVKLVLSVLMPCMVFNSFKNITFDKLLQSIWLLVISLCVCAFASLAGRYIYRRYPEEKQKVLRYSTLINNAGFAGLPLAEETFGSTGLAYASIFLIPIRIFMWSSGTSLLSNEKTSTKKLLITLAKNPCIIAVFLGIARGMAQITFFPFMESAISKLSACVSPLSMIIIGAIIADVDPRTIFEKGVLPYTAIRLIVFPIIVLSVTKLLGFDDVIVGTSMILTAMPAATSTALLAAQYNADVKFASKIVFVSTLASLITAPLLMFLL